MLHRHVKFDDVRASIPFFIIISSSNFMGSHDRGLLVTRNAFASERGGPIKEVQWRSR